MQAGKRKSETSACNRRQGQKDRWCETGERPASGSVASTNATCASRTSMADRNAATCNPCSQILLLPISPAGHPAAHAASTIGLTIPYPTEAATEPAARRLREASLRQAHQFRRVVYEHGRSRGAQWLTHRRPGHQRRAPLRPARRELARHLAERARHALPRGHAGRGRPALQRDRERDGS